jgi:hypothetical protein
MLKKQRIRSKKTKKSYKRKRFTRKRSHKIGGDVPIINNSDRQKMLDRMQQLMRLNQTNAQLYQDLDDRLYDIEQMNPDERQQHQDEYNQLESQINQLRQSNNESQREFEQLRQQYMTQYMSTTQA